MEIQAVVFFKVGPDGDVRVSMRSKYDVDVRVVASEFGGGGRRTPPASPSRGPSTRCGRASSGGW